jgi:glutathione synthase/RimK-type ligase-like ATP-grasp enzyme
MKFNANESPSDFITTLMMGSDYFTVEPFVPNKGDIRIQKIGMHTRAYRRVNLDNWKGNVGPSELEDIEMRPEFHVWAEECAMVFGGLDILSIDLLEREDGSLVVLELNDTATGLNPNHHAEDMQHIKELVLHKIHALVN